MSDVIELGKEFYIHPQSPLVDIQTRVLMRGDLFAVFDRCGDLRAFGTGGHGLFYNESRHLSKSVLRLADGPLSLLSSAVTLGNDRLGVDLTNPDLKFPDGCRLPRAVIHVRRTKFLRANKCEEEIRIRNFSLQRVSFGLVLELDADFADIFEVRWRPREKPRLLLAPEITGSSLTFGYLGQDKVLRKTTIVSSAKPAATGPSEMRWRIELEPQHETEFTITVACLSEPSGKAAARRTGRLPLPRPASAAAALRSTCLP